MSEFMSSLPGVIANILNFAIVLPPPISRWTPAFRAEAPRAIWTQIDQFQVDWRICDCSLKTKKCGHLDSEISATPLSGEGAFQQRVFR